MKRGIVASLGPEAMPERGPKEKPQHHPAMGRGRAVIDDDGRMRGRIFTHHADDTGFSAEKVGAKGKPRRRAGR